MRLVLVCSVLLGGVFASFQNSGASHSVGSSQISIGEVMASNRKSLADEKGQFEDYVVLRNRSNQPVQIGGMYLSDDWDKPKRWKIPAGTEIDAKSDLVIWADDQPEDGPLHTNFKLSAKGERVLLFDIDDRNNVMLDAVGFVRQRTDTPLTRVR